MHVIRENANAPHPVLREAARMTIDKDNCVNLPLFEVNVGILIGEASRVLHVLFWVQLQELQGDQGCPFAWCSRDCAVFTQPLLTGQTPHHDDTGARALHGPLWGAHQRLPAVVRAFTPIMKMKRSANIICQSTISEPAVQQQSHQAMYLQCHIPSPPCESSAGCTACGNM